MNWTQIKVTCLTEDLDNVTAIMSMLDNKLMIEDYSDIATGLNTIYGELIDEKILNADKAHASVSLYVDDGTISCNDYVAFIKERISAVGINAEIELIGVGDEDWENNWKKYYKPLKIGKNLMIVPMWEEYTPKGDEVIVKMDPGMAFGTGTHESTKLCAELIEKYMQPGMAVLDVGTGSGILAICESKLGAQYVDAYDIDPIAVRVAKENVEKNNVTNIECKVSDLLVDVDTSKGLYDFVSANIVADIIIRMAPDLPSVMKNGALVAVSGIIDEHAQQVIDTMDEYGLGLADINSENGWKGMLFKKIR